jgi:hypothetical protein
MAIGEQMQQDAMFTLVKNYHVQQTRDGGRTPYWVHCRAVAKRLEQTLAQTREGLPNERSAIVLAGYGHDLFEDTEIDPREINSKFGIGVNELIESLTNHRGDQDVKCYCEHLMNIPEAAGLIKLSDLYDNLTSSARAIQLGYLPATWGREFLVPILKPQWQVMQNFSFKRYTHSARIFCENIESAWQELSQAIQNNDQNL